MLQEIEKIGTTVSISLNGLNVEVKILDVKQSYGKVRYLVTPVAGSGQVWVERVNENRK